MKNNVKIIIFNLIFLSLSNVCLADGTTVLNFDQLKVGSTLNGWEQGFYGSKGAPVWKVEDDPTAPSKPHVLMQTGTAVYSWYVEKTPIVADGSVEADIKIISGKEDPETGLVWHHKNGKNYYYVRANAVEENIIFYRMNDGKKEVVKEADSKVGFNSWHHLKVQFSGEQIQVIFDGKQVISTKDAVLKDAGRIGFFTTADTIGAFDNFSYSKEK